MRYRQDIDGLRAIAVSVIVLFHFGVDQLAGGYVGVDVFFVISGYLITRLILDDLRAGTFSYRGFYMRRVRRIAPSLLATLALTLAGGYVFLSPAHFEALGLATQAAVLSVSNILFWNQSGYFDTDALYKPLLHTWSLAVEEQFYVVWPAALLALVRIAGLRGQLFGLLAVSLVSLVACELVLRYDPSQAFFLPIYRIYEFAFGAALAMTGLLARSQPVAVLSSVVGLGLILLASFTFTEEQSFPGLAALVPCLGAALLIYAGPQALVNKALSIAPLRYIGWISYSLYLVHWPILVFYAYSYGVPSTLAETGLLAALAIALAALLYHFVETPFRHRTPAGFRIRGKVLGVSMLSSALAITLAGGKIDEEKGYPGRLSDEMRALAEQIEEEKEARSELIRKDSCHVSEATLTGPEALQQGCLPAEATEAVVVLGDSHAADIWAGLSLLYPDRQVVQLTGAGCSLSRERAHERYCAVLKERALDWLRANASGVDAIVYSQRATTAMTGDPESDATALAPDEAAIAELRTELEAFAAFGIPVYFWGPRPEFHPEIGVVVNTYPTLEAVKAHFAEADYSAFTQMDRRLAAAFENSPVTYLPSLAPLCAPSCPILDTGNAPMLIDYGHWSPKGAELSVERVVAQTEPLRRLMGRAD